MLDEGLEAAWARHRRVGARLHAELPELGFRLVVAEKGHRLPELTTAWLPEGADDAALRKALLETYGIEVGGGLGEFAGKAWRIGLMGHSARDRSVTTLLGACELLADALASPCYAGGRRRRAAPGGRMIVLAVVAELGDDSRMSSSARCASAFPGRFWYTAGYQRRHSSLKRRHVDAAVVQVLVELGEVAVEEAAVDADGVAAQRRGRRPRARDARRTRAPACRRRRG